MPRRVACLTLDLEQDWPSTDSHEVLLNRARFGQFEEIFLRNQLKLTVFVVGRMLELGLPVQERFSSIDAHFELHSYSHNARETDTEAEIVRGKKAFSRYFGHPPKGYRAPNGVISPSGVETLYREGFWYDASVFPSWRPEFGYNFRKLPTRPWVYAEFPGFVELPFAVVPKTRIVISMSYLKLFGPRLFHLMFHLFGMPEVLVFDSHLYDFFPTKAVASLSHLDWRRAALMSNQNHSLKIFQEFVSFLKSKGYEFVHMNDLYNAVVTDFQSVPVVHASRLESPSHP